MEQLQHGCHPLYAQEFKLDPADYHHTISRLKTAIAATHSGSLSRRAQNCEALNSAIWYKSGDKFSALSPLSTVDVSRQKGNCQTAEFRLRAPSKVMRKRHSLLESLVKPQVELKCIVSPLRPF